MHLVNGKQAEQISLNDRGFLYGQSVFETIAVDNQTPLLLDEHIQRLDKGCKLLSIPLNTTEIVEEILGVCDQLDTELNTRSVVRVMVSMGEGGRGYLNPHQPSSTRIVSVYDYPDYPDANWQKGIEVGVSEVRLSKQPLLAGIKHGNRLEQILAKSTWHENWQEALMLDEEGQVIEATQSNLFVQLKDRLLTPDLSCNGVSGIMRDQVLKAADKIGVKAEIVSLSLAEIEAAQEVFLSNSLIGVWPVKKLNSTIYKNFDTSHKLLKILRDNGSIPTN